MILFVTQSLKLTHTLTNVILVLIISFKQTFVELTLIILFYFYGQFVLVFVDLLFISRIIDIVTIISTFPW